MIPTPVDTNRFSPSKERLRRSKKEVVIGWIGISETVVWVRLLEKVFQALAKRYPIRVKLITRPGNETFDLPPTRFEIVRWSYETEVQEMEEIDIGVMPLPDTEWSKGKCSLKLLQYMAMGLPSVSSRVGMNCEIVEEGVDGLRHIEILFSKAQSLLGRSDLFGPQRRPVDFVCACLVG